VRLGGLLGAVVGARIERGDEVQVDVGARTPRCGAPRGQERVPQRAQQVGELVVAVAAVACGGSSASSGTNASSGTSSGGGAYSYGSKPKSTPAPAGVAAIKTASGGPGTFLVDSRGRTLYRFVADKGAKSTCSGECARDWPPLTTTSKPRATGGAKAALLGTTKRSDGKLQVTFAGHPLYYFAGDSGPGKTSGQGSSAFGAYWWVVGPSGAAITG
jgi:predicted lipoprotein with Yx(FWY)xxD motif